MAINRVILTGRLGKDIELKSAGKVDVASFSIAVDSFTKDEKGNYIAHWINCVAFDKQAQFLDTYCKKGNSLAIEGHLQTRNYDGKNGKVYVTEVVVDRVENLSPKDANSTKSAGYSMSGSSNYAEEDNDDDNNTLVASDNDLPF